MRDAKKLGKFGEMSQRGGESPYFHPLFLLYDPIKMARKNGKIRGGRVVPLEEKFLNVPIFSIVEHP